jgi:hypothetical protein
MPRTVVTAHTMPIILHEIDKWQGKLTWKMFSECVAKKLQEKHVGRHTLISYPAIKDAFDLKKKSLKKIAKEKPKPIDITLELAIAQIEMLESKNQRLERKNALFHEQFVRWQENLRKMPGVDMKTLIAYIDKPLPKVVRK